MSLRKYQSGMEGANALLIKIEGLVREILLQNNISYYRIDAGFDIGQDTYDNPVIRVVSYFEDTVCEIAKMLGNEFDLAVVEQSAGNKSWIDGFSSNRVQYLASLKTNRSQLTEYKRWGNKPFELQICCMLQDAWAGMEKELGFDSGAPGEVRRDFNRIGALLEMANIEFLKIKKSTQESKQGQHREEPVMSSPPVVNYGYVAPKQAEEPQPQTIPVVNTHVENVAVNIPPAPHANGLHVNGVKAAEMKHMPVNGIDTGMERNGIHREVKPTQPIQPVMDENVAITEANLKAFVESNPILKGTDQRIAEKAGAKLNTEIDIHGDVERLAFLRVFTLKQLHDRLIDNLEDVVLFAEKWIGKDNGGTFDSGISLFYLEYVLVAQKNDPDFAVEYVLKFISDNDYSARYIIPTYTSMRLAEQASKFTHAAVK
jgi:hypothetical protein